MVNRTAGVKYQMILDPALSAAIDEWAWQRRVKSRAEAIRNLLDQALQDDRKSAAIEVPRAEDAA